MYFSLHIWCLLFTRTRVVDALHVVLCRKGNEFVRLRRANVEILVEEGWIEAWLRLCVTFHLDANVEVVPGTVRGAAFRISPRAGRSYS